MSKPVVVLFSGQGSQKVGMGLDLVEEMPELQAVFENANHTVGYDLAKVMFEGPVEELTRTSRCQPALYTHGLALLDLLRARLPDLQIAAAAGLSLGEFTAHAAAGTFDRQTGLNLVFQRGTFMEEACTRHEGAMLALLGGEESAVRELAALCDVDVANLNAPGQIVLSGLKSNLEDAAAKAKEHGIKRAIPLPVAGAYHSRLMQSAQDQLASILSSAAIQPPSIPVISNVEAAPISDPEAIRSALTRQVTGSVRWTESMQYLINEGHQCFVELGPDATLAGLIGKIDKSVQVVSIKDVSSLNAAIAEMAG